MWCGIISPIWIFIGFAALFTRRSSGNMILDDLVIFGLWWGIALLLAVSGILSGYKVGAVAGALTIIGFVGFLLAILNGGFSD
jgi:hypothetical protein